MEDIAYPRLQCVHGHSFAVYRIEAKLLIVVAVHRKDETQRLALTGAGVANNRGKDDSRRHTVNERFVFGLGAQDLELLVADAGQPFGKQAEECIVTSAAQVDACLFRGGVDCLIVEFTRKVGECCQQRRRNDFVDLAVSAHGVALHRIVQCIAGAQRRHNDHRA